jgi:hypothetical protein
VSDPNLPIGKQMCKCTVCGLYFSGAQGFDRHRVGDVGTPARRCLTERELMEAGWTTRGRGPYWQYQPKPKSQPASPCTGQTG